MPKPRRDSASRADTRPAFNRPPGSKAPPPSSYPRIARYDVDDDESDGERRTPKRKSHNHREKHRSSPAASPANKARRGGAGEKRKVSGAVRESPRGDRVKYNSGTSSGSTSQLLTVDSLATLNHYNEKSAYDHEKNEASRKRKEKQYKNLKGPDAAGQRRRKRKKNRNVSGAILEEGRGGGGGYGKRRGGGYDEKDEIRRRDKGRGGRWSRWKWWIGGLILVALAILIPIAVVASNKNKNKSASGGQSSSPSENTGGPTNDCDASSIPPEAKGTYIDISTWMDTTDFNCTYTKETVGGLSVMGLFSKWDDSTKANDYVPALDEKWEYGKRPIRGINVGGWFSIEPFITPSLFNYPASAQVVDEYSLSAKLGPAAARIIENHYATFITKQSFVDIANAGLDHVRIPFPYWAVTTYEGDPYVPKIAWRYLLRAIEWARESGLRVNLDLHAAPGSQNGWAHSGHQGNIDWISGPNGAVNAQRTLDIHDQLSKFFAQDRYKNVIAIYGLVNEPKMLVIPPQSVLDWNTKAVALIRGNGIKQYIAFGDGFLSLSSWDNTFQDVDSKLVMDTHQYQIFNVGQLKLAHQDKINLACSGWSGLMVAANNPATGWGPILDGEWSQADTDCTQYLNNVGVGSRWAGTLNTGDPQTSVLTSTCPSPPCTCAQANADPNEYSDSYRQFLKMYAEAQMHSFEKAWGWFYWTWKTESAVQWSWMLGLQAGILPTKAYEPGFKCDSDVPDFADLSGGV